MKYAAAAPAICCCHHPREYDEILPPLTQAAAAPFDLPATDKTNNNMIVATVYLNKERFMRSVIKFVLQVLFMQM